MDASILFLWPIMLYIFLFQINFIVTIYSLFSRAFKNIFGAPFRMMGLNK